MVGQSVFAYITFFLFKRCTVLTVLCFTLLLTVALPSHAQNFNAGLTATPNPNTGNFTLNWNRPLDCGSDTLLDIYLKETGPAGIQYYYIAFNATSYSFTGKPEGSYQYQFEVSCEDWDMIESWIDYSEIITVTVNGNPSITPPPAEGSADIVGSNSYQLDVGADGDAIAQVPLQLVAGINGFKPDLALEYDSGRGIDRLDHALPEDTLGYGWRLAGLPQIRRCVVNQASGNSIALNNNDSLCLNNMPLVLSSGSHWQPGAVYRTLIESYIKVELKGSAGALWFEASLPDGTKQLYGNTAGSRVDKNGGTDYQWSISKATSTDGNVVDYEYFHDINNGINHPTKISYSNAVIEFEYQSRSDAGAVWIGSAAQTQSVLLHTIKLSFRNKRVREYRLFDELAAGKRRLKKIQLCGYDENGVSASCLAPLQISWTTPANTMAGVDFLVSGFTDGLGANYQWQYGTITGSSHPFLFTERPFGNGVLPANTQLLSGSGAQRHVVTKLRRDNGLGAYHDTRYAYQNRGLRSTKHWGFLGFYTQRITDEQSGVVTYAQYRLDYPYFGQLARLYQYNNTYGAHTQLLSRTENRYQQHSINHGSNSSSYPYLNSRVDFIIEAGTQLGATKTQDTLTLSSGFISQIDSVQQTGTSATAGSVSGIWGDVPDYSISGIARTRNSSNTFTNRSSGGQWLIHFVNDISTQSWSGAPAGAGLQTKTTYTPHASSLKIASSTRFPGNASLELTTAYTYYNKGNTQDITVSGANVNSRYTWMGYTEDRYVQDIDKRINMNTNLQSRNVHDVRFGKPKLRGYFSGRQATFTYDPLGRVISHANHEGTITTTTFQRCSDPLVNCPNVNGRQPVYRKQSDSPVTPVQRTYYDVLGRVVRSETESFDGSFSKRDIQYDNQGRVQSTSVPYFSSTTYATSNSYDIHGRLVQTTRADGSSVSTAFSVSGNTVIATITEAIKKADGSSDSSQVKRNEFNILGQLIKTTDAYGSADAISVTYTYDAHGNQLTATVDGGTHGSTTTYYEYDASGNRTKVIDPNSGTTTTTYTALGEVKTITDNKAQTITFHYDSVGRLTSKVSIDGTTTWGWDTNGTGKLAWRTTGSDFSQYYFYNSAGKLSSSTVYVNAIGQTTTETYITSYTWDSYGRPSTTSYPSGITVSRHYNARGYLAQLKNGSSVLKTFNQQDAFGHNTQSTFGNGVVTQKTFDPRTGFITDIDSNKGSTTIQNNQYAWRSNATLESRLASPNASHADTRKESFAYDALNRVTQASTMLNTVSSRSLNYQYNRPGNITSKTSTQTGDDNVTAYNYGAGSAGPHALTSVSVNGVNYTLSYDANGAITHYDIAGTSTDKYISYNATNQPNKIVVGTSLTDTNPQAVDEFRYDPDGKLYARKTTWKQGAATYTENVRYIGDVEYITLTADPNDILSTYKTRIGNDIIHVKTQVDDPVNPPFDPYWVSHTEYAHRDHLGSIEAVTDDSGNILNTLAFEPFGERKSPDWSSNISASELTTLLEVTASRTRKVRGFTGHRHLDRTGFIHMNGRVYDPLLGRFLSPDPVVQSPGNSQSWNRYSYVFNNPLRYVDPTGFVADWLDSELYKEEKSQEPSSKSQDDERAPQDDESNNQLRPGECNATGCRAYVTNDSYDWDSVVDEILGDLVALQAERAAAQEETWGFKNNADGDVVLCLGSGACASSSHIGSATTVDSAMAVAELTPWGKFLRFFKFRKFSGGLCFVEGTPVHTKDGLKPIEEVQVGDLVAAKDEVTGKVSWKPVVNLFQNDDKKVVWVTLVDSEGNEEVIGATLEHPFWVDGRGWVEASKLSNLDKVVSRDGNLLDVVEVNFDSKEHTTYNFEVQHVHTYFVGKHGIWVHNASQIEIPDSPIGSLKNRSASWLKRQGVDPHALKDRIGDSRLDIYVDKANNIWTQPKKGNGGVPQWQGTLDMFKDGG